MTDTSTEHGRPAEADRLRQRCEELESRIVELEFERDGYYGEWRHAKNQLGAIKRSPVWLVWLLWRVIWGILVIPFRLLGALPRAFGWLWLLVASWWQLGRARLRPEPSTIPSPEEIETPPARPRVLIVTPYSIFPPNHGGAVRLFNLVQELADRCELFVLIFNQLGEDPEQRSALEAYCSRVDFHHWIPRREPDRFGQLPPSAQLFESELAADKIRDLVLGFNIDIVQLEYTELGQYHSAVPDGVPVILTEHDLAFRSFARRRSLGFHHRFPEGKAYGSSRSDWRRLLLHELRVDHAVDQIHVMSEDDGRFLSRFLADGVERIRVAPNGVSCSYYETHAAAANRSDVLYVGNFQNLPNVDALEFFVLDVWPLIRIEDPDARLTVVGANPTARVERFDGQDGIQVVGAVPDLRPYYHGHRTMVAPIRAGSGTRLKILEAFAAGLPVVSTTLGAEGISYEEGAHLLIADSAAEFARAVGRVLSDDTLAGSLASAGLELARDRYDWKIVAEILLDCYAELSLEADPDHEVGMPELTDQTGAQGIDALGTVPEVSIIIPTLNGGEMLDSCLGAIAAQQAYLEWELICIDSGSRESDLEIMRRHGVRILAIDTNRFNHGLTRDLAARHSRGEILVFLNQDAVPGDEHWLRRLTEALVDGARDLAAVQGGILELPDPKKRFFWDSCGERFYFTRESFRWLDQYRGIGFSTVNCAIRRAVWDRHPFGWARIMEDKKWQREVVDTGYQIVARPDAAVFHTHDYDLRALLRRCSSEGSGWRSLGESYRLHHMLRDMLKPRVYRELLTGLVTGRIRSSAELLFPWARPIALWWGNHLARDVAL